VVIYAYNFSPELPVVKQPQSTRVEEPALLCNHVDLPFPITRTGFSVRFSSGVKWIVALVAELVVVFGVLLWFGLRGVGKSRQVA
jgi:hypothetical protein